MTYEEEAALKEAERLKEHYWSVQTELWKISDTITRLIFPRNDSRVTNEVNDVLLAASDMVADIRHREAKIAQSVGVSFADWEYPPTGELPRRITTRGV